MDLSDAFLADITNVTYSSFQHLSIALEEHFKATKVNFHMGKRGYFPESSPYRYSLVYKSLIFECNCKQNKGCSAFFSVGCRQGRMHIVRYNMLHNHDRDEISYDQEGETDVNLIYQISCDFTSEFILAFPTLTFSSLCEFTERLEKFQQATGSVFVKRHAAKWPKTEVKTKQQLVYRRVCFECIRYGHCGYAAKRKLRHQSCKMGCKARIIVSSQGDFLKVIAFDMRHNHAVSRNEGTKRHLQVASIEKENDEDENRKISKCLKFSDERIYDVYGDGCPSQAHFYDEILSANR